MASLTGAQVIARSLRGLGVTVVFGIVGIPVVDIAEEAIDLGIQFIGFRNEQAAGYAASVYGYLTGRPGVCLVVGGPGVLHALPGVANSSANAFPLLLLAGSAETHLIAKGAFQELDAISFLTPHTKQSLRPPSLDAIPDAIHNAYRTACYGRPGPSFIDFPADVIQGTLTSSNDLPRLSPLASAPTPSADETSLFKVAQLLKTARSPLIVIGKGAAYARASDCIGSFVSQTQIPFLPTPMGKGVLPDSHPLNAASARSAALKEADMTPPFAIHGDLSTVIPQLQSHLPIWSYTPGTFPYLSHIQTAKDHNLAAAAKKASITTLPLSYPAALSAIESTLHALSPPEDGNIVYVSEGANTMDISRSIFPVSHPRLRLDAGTHATMGVGMGYAIAAHIAYNGLGSQPGEAQVGPSGLQGASKKKIVCLEGDSAFGFSAMEVETMARYGMDVLIFVINNGGVYHGDADSRARWEELQQSTLSPGSGPTSPSEGGANPGLRSTSLSFGTAYQNLATMVGGLGIEARTIAEVERATREGWACGKVCVVNVLVGKGEGGKLAFGWQQAGPSARKSTGGGSNGGGGEERREKGKGGRGARL